MKVIQLGSISVIHSDWLPYATGCLISHCMSHTEIKSQYVFNTLWYKYQPIEDYQLEFSGIDILGLTCYVWNQNYNDKLSREFKRFYPDRTVIYGGPNVPADPVLAAEYANKRPWVNLHFVGPGEVNFSNWLISGNTQGTFSVSHFAVGDVRTYQVEQMPTPYTDGVFDTILSSTDKIKASFETNRGCPYACAFCDWGGQAQSKLTRFDHDVVKQQIDHIYQHRNIHEVEILDANFGILKQDVDIIHHMIHMQTVHDHKPLISYSGLAKNGSKWLPEILNLIFTQLPISQRNLKISFQTHSTETLDVIQRSNIDNTKLYPLIQSYKEQGIPTTSEMIIALPGETADSWLQSLDHNYRLGIDYIRTYFLNIVPNTPMYSNEYRNTHGIKTKLLRFPYEFSNLSYKALHLDINHTCSNTADQEEVEIAYQCNSYDLDELLRMFDYHWFYHNLINTDGIKPIVQDVVSETNAVFASLDRMPFIRSLVEKNRTIVQQMFAPDPVTDITSLGSYLYFSRCMRTDDVYQLWNNQQAVVDELGLIYGTVAVSNCVAKWKKQFDMQLYGTDANLRSSNA